MTENEIATQVVDAAYKIHTGFSPGLLESVYEALMAHHLAKRGLPVLRQQAIPFVHESIRMDVGFRADLIIDDKVIVEINIDRGHRANSPKTASNVSAACR